jgi:replicative DNA helicase
MKESHGEQHFDNLLQKIKDRQERAISGKLNCIPLPFERTRRFFPGIEKSCITIVTASSGVAKSKFTRFLYVYHVYKYIKENPNADIRIKIFYFSLEESKERFFLSLISKWLYDNHRLRISIKQLLSIGEQGCHLNDEIIELVTKAKEYFIEFTNYVTVIEEVRNPTGFYKIMQEYLENNGTWTFKTVIREGKEMTIKDRYIPNDSELYVIGIVDHVSLMQPEKDNGIMMTLHQTINKWSSDYCIGLRNQYGASIINVQQQSAEKEKKQFTMRGGSIDEKLEPSLDGLADCKLTARDADVVIGLFAPDRYQIDNYENYDIRVFQDYFRMLLFLKTRDGEANMRTALFFDGMVGDFKELPKMDDALGINRYYEYIRKIK